MVMIYDALERAIQVRESDSVGTVVIDTRSRYIGVGWVDRVSLFGDYVVIDVVLMWMKIIYDKAGWAIKIFVYYDFSFAVGFAIEVFEILFVDNTIVND